MSLAFVGVLITFTTDNEPLNRIAPLLIGFGMLFIGLEVMEMAIGGADSTKHSTLQSIHVSNNA